MVSHSENVRKENNIAITLRDGGLQRTDRNGRCMHGIYVGGIGTADYMCGGCEDGYTTYLTCDTHNESSWVHYTEADKQFECVENEILKGIEIPSEILDHLGIPRYHHQLA